MRRPLTALLSTAAATALTLGGLVPAQAATAAPASSQSSAQHQMHQGYTRGFTLVNNKPGYRLEIYSAEQIGFASAEREFFTGNTAGASAATGQSFHWEMVYWFGRYTYVDFYVDVVNVKTGVIDGVLYLTLKVDEYGGTDAFCIQFKNSVSASCAWSDRSRNVISYR